MDSLEVRREIAALRRRLAAALMLHYCLRTILIWSMFWACGVVVLRVAGAVERPLLVWGAVGYGPAILAGVWLTLRRVPAAAGVRAALDCRNRLGGLLMAGGELDIGQWTANMPGVERPAVRLRAGRHWAMLAATAAFLAVALWLPDRYLPAQDQSLQLGAEMDKLKDKLAALKQEKLIPPEKADLLEKDLEELRNKSLGRQPAKTTEALDHLEGALTKTAAAAAETALKNIDAAARAEQLAEALQQAQDKMDEKQLDRAMKELAEMTNKAAAECQSLADALDTELTTDCRESDLSSAQLEKLSEALRNCKSCERGRIERLVKARLIEVDDLIEAEGKCKGCPGEDLEEIIVLLGRCKGDEDLDEAIQCISAGLPGRGGVNRGRGDAAMTWSKGTNKENVSFKEKVLPPGTVDSLKESRLAGISASAPKTDTTSEGSSGGALGAAKSGGGEARQQTILPQHQKPVQKYFERGTNK
jgi:hypothetical protein